VWKTLHGKRRKLGGNGSLILIQGCWRVFVFACGRLCCLGKIPLS